MYNQSNVRKVNQVITSKRPTKRRKIGCLGCFGYCLLTILVVVVGFFVFNTIRNKIEEKEQQKLEARFDYEQKLSAEDKLTQAFNKGEISADTYILQMAYSLYDVEKLDPLYKSDNDVDFAPDLFDLIIRHIDELSDATLEYLAKNIMMTDIRIHPDASQNRVAYEKKWQPFSEYVFANEYDITILDRAVLSPSGKFLIWYTETGEGSISREIAQKLANTVENIADDISEFLDVEWDYDYQELNSDSYEDMKKVLNECGIDENAIKEALPVYVYDPPRVNGAVAWYVRNFDPIEKFGNWLQKVIFEEDELDEKATVYSAPYIVIKTSVISDMESLNALFAHELTHHFQRIYYNNLEHNPPKFTSETVANFVSASINENKGTNTILNRHANDSMDILDYHFDKMVSGNACGYGEFVWAKSYVDIIPNGKQYLWESLLEEENPFKFLREKAGDSYQLVLEDFAVRNITKDYQEKGFISTKFPNPKATLSRYMDTEEHIIHPNCLHYYYLDIKSFYKSTSTIHIKNTEEAKIFIKVLGRKKQNYSLLDTLYCDMGKELMIADFSKDDYKKYDELIFALGNCDTVANSKYQIKSLSPASIALYEVLTGLKDVDPWEVNGDCITINVKDFMKGATTLTDFLVRIIPYVSAEMNSEDSPIVVEFFEYLRDEIDRIGEAFKQFGDMFDYKTVRIYTMPVNDSVLSDDEIHKMALDMMPNPKLKIIDKVEDGMHLSMGGGIQPFSKTQLIFYTVITKPGEEKVMYRIEFEK
ncbi:hypothetical protein [Acetivibrio mesophilus]|uniref:Uncharacterized protein n=1 Tax=Acetivibrio mesophilus TaxID=2487273 RepID=A0A4Q0IAW8_9FIRM|nr:hypothetical protein [Acetivibrio mesophilus]RXE60222.1 hypothetical protein EFD62_03075 [Acetivibrio mesophilus]